MRVTRAEYRGQDTKGRPFALVAGSAVQKSSAEPIVRMTDLSGAISLDDGPATIAAEHAQYDMDSETVTVPGTVLVRGPTGTASRSEEHTSELQSLMRNSYAVFCLKKKEHKLICMYIYIELKIE